VKVLELTLFFFTQRVVLQGQESGGHAREALAINMIPDSPCVLWIANSLVRCRILWGLFGVLKIIPLI